MKLTCEQVIERDLASRYLSGDVSEDERGGYESHFFECASCFGELEACRILQSEVLAGQAEEIARQPRASRPNWANIMAMAALPLLAAIGIWWFLWPQLAGPDAAEFEARLTQLASFEPPEYHPAVLRGVSDAATRHFRAGMERYRSGRYAEARDELAIAATLNGESPGILFYLAVCDLQIGNSSQAIAGFQRTIALGDSPYLEEAHWYLAKAFLGDHDIAAATAELQTLRALGGDMENEAGRLLSDLAELSARRSN